MKAVILCGGYGTRMGTLCSDIPKPMTIIAGKTVLEYQIEVLKKEGITDFIFVVGYLYQKIIDYFSDGKSLGVNISYFIEEKPLGTAGALFHLDLKEDFLLCNGDLIFDFDLNAMYVFHKEKNALATLFTHPNTHPYDSTLIETDKSGRILSFVFKNSDNKSCKNLCNAGIQILSPELLGLHNIENEANFDKDIIMPIIKTGRIFSYKSTEYVYDMGTPERVKKVEADIFVGKPLKRRLFNKQKAIFLDRDGTVNVYKDFITKEDDIELTEGAGEAIATFNKLGFLVIIITNQPVIARGECTESQLENIHGRLETLLGEKGAFIDDIFYCPHHPDDGFEGEIKELKIKCYCRKPSPGLLFEAQKKYNIDMSKSYMIGDRLIDIQAGKNAGCIPVFLGERSDVGCMKFNNLKEFADSLDKIN